ncbi:hypothetical protein QVD99_003352 [Batrachochytrium dendrobatidis]|nr:hypothetical protein QVD99_003352 [Batrachochytrium dendrobatidis]
MGYDNDSPPTHGSGQARPPGPHATRHFLVIGFSNVLGLAEAARLMTYGAGTPSTSELSCPISNWEGDSLSLTTRGVGPYPSTLISYDHTTEWWGEPPNSSVDGVQIS